MTKRVLGVLAALTLGGSMLACSSSSSGGTPAADTGPKTDGGTDAKTDVKTDTGPAPVVYPNPGTTGIPCMGPDDCDPEGVAPDHAFCVALPQPTPICILRGDTDACDYGGETTYKFCDNNKGLCTKYQMNPSVCDAKCELNTDGTWKQQCAGSNACSVVDAVDIEGKRVLLGTCEAGCQSDTDCKGVVSSGPTKCDPVLQYCLPSCKTDADCKLSDSTLWKCDTTRLVCMLNFPKKIGETCTTANDCAVCMKATADASGYCSQLCKTGGSAACPTGFSCDLGLPAKDKMGADLVTFTTAPTGMQGLCLKNCAADTECITGQVCVASAGTAQKTCQPKPATM